MADAGAASLRVSGLELGGLFGSLLAGKLSDMLINNSKGGGGNVGKRVQVRGGRPCARRPRGGWGACMQNAPAGMEWAQPCGPAPGHPACHARSYTPRPLASLALHPPRPTCHPPAAPQVIIAYTLGIAAMLMAFAAVPASMGWMQWATVFMIGFFLYGPQVPAAACPTGCAVLAPCLLPLLLAPPTVLRLRATTTLLETRPSRTWPCRPSTAPC